MNICVLGGNSITKFAKKSSETDLKIYSRNVGDVVNLIVPNYEKVRTIPFSLHMADFVVFEIDKIDKYVGESILFANEFKKPGIIVTKFDVDEIIRGTFLKNYEVVESISSLEEIAEKFKDLKFKSSGGTKILIDQYFKVKGVGDVVLGFVKSGEVRKFEKLISYPSKEEYLVKSIQIMSKNVDSASVGDRVGLALKSLSKGVSNSMELRRGIVLSSSEIPVVEKIRGKFLKSEYYKKEIKGKFQITVGLQDISGEISDDELKLDRKVALETFGDPILALNPSSFPRLAGRFEVG